MNSATIVQKLWNYSNGPRLGRSLAGSPAREHAGVHEKPRLTLRDDGMSYGDYVEQLTYLLFGSGVTSRFARYEPTPQQAGTPACCLKMADVRTKAAYNQKGLLGLLFKQVAEQVPGPGQVAAAGSSGLRSLVLQ